MFRLNPIPRGQRAGAKGFTLIELMVTLAILGLIMSVVYRVFSTQERMFRTQEQVAAMQENLRSTVEYVNQEMSWIGYNVSGIAVLKASPIEIIYRANIPNTGQTVQVVRYKFDPINYTISRAAGDSTGSVVDTNMSVMARDIENVNFSYYNLLNAELTTDAADPLCSSVLSAEVCSPSTPSSADAASLLMIQRVKSVITARTARPDFSYTDPEGGPNPNYRKRSAVLDLKARNVENNSLNAGQIGLGSCGYLTHTITIPQNPYVACPDKITQFADGTPDLTGAGLSDNPTITIQAYNAGGSLNTNANMSVSVYAVGSDNTPFSIYDSANPYNVDNNIANGETRYVAANVDSGVTEGNTISLHFAYSDGVCTQQLYDGSVDIVIAPSAATQFDTTGAYGSGGISVGYVDLETGSDLGLTAPEQVAMCSTVSHQGITLLTKLMDACSNPIDGETVTYSDGGAGGTFIDESDNGDGTYSATYVPPPTMTPASTVAHPVTLGVQWGSETLTTTQTLIAGEPHDIVIDSIVDVTQAGIFQFEQSVPPRATQLGGNSGSSFKIERVDGQEVRVRFHIEDACGNWVHNVTPINISESTPVSTTPVSHSNGSYTFRWEWNNGCGGERLGETITIGVPDIADAATNNEIIVLDLLETRSSTDASGPFLVMDQVTGDSLQAGNTGDYVTIHATVTQYHPEEGYCTNIPGEFPVDWTLTGDAGGNGSFNNATPFDQDTASGTTNAAGLAQVNVYSGTADWDDHLALKAVANIANATYEGNIAIDMKASNIEEASGIYDTNLYLTEIGMGHPKTTFDPGKDDLYFMVYDFDENEDPLTWDSYTLPYDVEVDVESALTGDVETIPLTEWMENNAQFRGEMETQFASFPVAGDGVLQTIDGDTVTVYYQDKDPLNEADNKTWTIFTPGADFFKVYLVDGASEIELVNPGPFQQEVLYGDQVRPKLSLPFLAGDGRSELDTVHITVNSGADDDDTVTLREDGDTGILVPDWLLYAGAHFTVAQSVAGDPDDVLLTPTTPRYVTLTYDQAGSYAMSARFFMKDTDPPEVTITQPGDGTTVSGQVTVIVNANDVANATTWSGIRHIDLLVNGRIIDSLHDDDGGLTGDNTFIWNTATAGVAYWVDGDHVLTAVAYDYNLNQATTVPGVTVTVSNGLSPIWITQPAPNTIWSSDVNIGIRVDLAAEAGTYDVVLVDSGGMGALLDSWTAVGGQTFAYTYTTDSLLDGSYAVEAALTDADGKSEFTGVDFIVDHTPPDITIGSPFDQTWINRSDFPLTVQALIQDPKVAPIDPNDVDDATVRGQFSGDCTSGYISMTEMPSGSGTYVLSSPWDLTNCNDVEGVLRFTAEADDLANPPNQASQAASTRVDTKRPEIISFDVIPMVNAPFTMGSATIDGFISGSVTLSASVMDAYPQTGAFFGWFFNDPYVSSSPPNGTLALAAGPLDATSSTFSYAWPTGGDPEGIYLLAPGVKDAAGNSSVNPPRKIVYLDNTAPWSDLWVNSPSGDYSGLVYVNPWAEDMVGFLSEVQYSIISSATGTAVWTTTMSFTPGEKVRYYDGVEVVDLSGFSEGIYHCQSSATDWAGNTTNNFMNWCFEKAPVREIDTTVPIPAEVVFNPVGSGLYTATVQGGTLVDGMGFGVPLENLEIYLYRQTWNGASYGYYWSDWALLTTGSSPAGAIPSFSSVADTQMVFEESDRAVVYYYHQDPWQWLGTMTAYLGSPMVPVPPGSQTFEGTEMRILVDDLDFQVTPSGVDEFTVQVSGTLRYTNGDPVNSAPMRIGTWYEKPLGTWVNQNYAQTTDSFGQFSFTLPEYYLVEGELQIIFYDELDNWMGGLYWNPWMERWEYWF